LDTAVVVKTARYDTKVTEMLEKSAILGVFSMKKSKNNQKDKYFSKKMFAVNVQMIFQHFESYTHIRMLICSVLRPF